jgi:uncharacterized repeat protein (TIGR01451 family)
MTASFTPTSTVTATDTATITVTSTETATFEPSSTQSLTATAEALNSRPNVASSRLISQNRQDQRRCTLLTVGVTCQSNGVYPALQTQTIDTSRPYILKVADSSLAWGDGSELTWTIRVVNPTARSLSNVIVVDELPDDLAFVSADRDYQRLNDGSIRFQIGRLEGYESASIRITTRLLSDAGMVINRVCLDYRRLDDQLCNSAQAFNISNLPLTGESPFSIWRIVFAGLAGLAILVIWKGRMLWQQR